MFDKIKQYYQQTVPNLQNEQWQSLEEKLTFQHLKKGELLTKQGDICRSVSFINKGLLRMFYVVDGKKFARALLLKTNTWRSTTAS